MATGTGERPLGTPAQEKQALGISGLETPNNSGSIRFMRFGFDANTTRYLSFPGNATKYGIVFFDGAASTKQGCVQYGAGTNSSMHIKQISAPTQSGTSVTAGGKSSNNPVWIKITNGANYMYGFIIAYDGPLPTITSTEPT